MKLTYLLELVLDTEGEDGVSLPSDEQVCSALSHSTAGEALSDATGCTACISLIGPVDPIRLQEIVSIQMGS